jgi:predicted CXXCH cytochrome family protein
MLAPRMVRALALLVCLAACRGRPSGAPATEPERPRVASNIFRGDYAGSKECRFCHAEIYAAWERSPMRNMTRRAGRARIRAPFDGASFRLRDDTVTMEERDGRRFMTIASSGDVPRLFRVTKVIGGRYREDFAGIEVTGAADPGGDRGHGAEKILPASWVFSTQSWRYKGYSVLVPERPGLRAGPIWANNCISCHNTLPYADLLLDDVFGPDAPSYQGTVSDDILPARLLWRPTVRDEGGLAAAIRQEIAFLGAAPPAGGTFRELLLAGMAAMRRRFAGEHLVEVGVGCEACHGGSRAHVEDPTVLPTFEPRSALLAVGPPDRRPSRAELVNRTCARCHTVLFSAYPFTWEGRLRDGDPGGSSINSGEARDFLLGGCSAEMSCVDCHDPHAEDDPARLRELLGVRGNTLCVRCHAPYRGADALARHTHHRPDGRGSACAGCHMPRKNMGLGYALTAYHRIGSPTDDERVLGDRPLECAICHPDQSVATIVDTMERWWGRRYDRGALRALYGDLGGNALEQTLARGKAHEQAVAIVVLGETKAARAVPLLAPHLAHDYPLVRFFARHALETITGQSIPIDVNEAREAVIPAAARWLAEWQARTSTP